VRAVFDTNVVVPALIFGRRLVWLRRAWAAGAVTPIVCREIAAELLRVLAYPKFRVTAADRETLLAEYLPHAEVVALASPLPALPVASRDSDDDIFLHLAVVSRADMLVSGDDDLAALSGVYPVVSPEALRDLLQRESGL
jgi:putative PIN family toxin of toxin-antitoxin system